MEDSDGERTHLSLAAYNMTFRHSPRLSCRFFFSPFPCYFPRGFQNINFNFLCIAWCLVRTLNRSGMSQKKKHTSYACARLLTVGWQGKTTFLRWLKRGPFLHRLPKSLSTPGGLGTRCFGGLGGTLVC